MLALLQASPTSDLVGIPAWMVGMFGAIFLVLLAIIGFLIKYVMGSFKAVLKELRESLEKAVAAFQAFEKEAPREFVTHSYFELARKELKDDITHGHKRISEFAATWQKNLDDHKADCPARSRV